jgi:ankyrin repeat protein
MSFDLPSGEPIAKALKEAIQSGNTGRLEALLREHPGIANARIISTEKAMGCGRTLLHIATDWPGHFPNVAETIEVLVRHGADVNARFTGRHSETPLHWAASSNDVTALDALIDRGADIEATGAVIAAGTPLADAVAFGQWEAARRLVERGARTTLWEAAALGLLDRVANQVASGASPDNADLTKAFWCACHGGQRETAEYLLRRGADLNWRGYDRLTPLGAAKRSGADALSWWLGSQGAID